MTTFKYPLQWTGFLFLLSCKTTMKWQEIAFYLPFELFPPIQHVCKNTDNTIALSVLALLSLMPKYGYIFMAVFSLNMQPTAIGLDLTCHFCHQPVTRAQFSLAVTAPPVCVLLPHICPGSPGKQMLLTVGCPLSGGSHVILESSSSPMLTLILLNDSSALTLHFINLWFSETS